MSQETNVWRKRPTISLNCPSGVVATVRRPSPGVMLKAGRVARIFQRQKPEDVNDVNKQLEFIESLPEDELAAVWSFARVVVCETVIQPPVFLNPKDGQFGVDDIELLDFWFIFSWAQNGGPDMPVALQEGETTIEAVHNFPSGQGTSDNAGEDGPAM